MSHNLRLALFRDPKDCLTLNGLKLAGPATINNRYSIPYWHIEIEPPSNGFGTAVVHWVDKGDKDLPIAVTQVIVYHKEKWSCQETVNGFSKNKPYYDIEHRQYGHGENTDVTWESPSKVIYRVEGNRHLTGED